MESKSQRTVTCLIAGRSILATSLNPTLACNSQTPEHLEALSFGFCDQILDDPLTTEEIEMAVRKIKSNRSGGADGLTAEHLKHGGPAVVVWLKHIFNLIISLEQVPLPEVA